MPAETELNNIRTAVSTMLSAAVINKLVGGINCQLTDLSVVTAIDSKGCTLYLSDYVPGLPGTFVTSGYAYIFDENGGVTQVPAK